MHYVGGWVIASGGEVLPIVGIADSGALISVTIFLRKGMVDEAGVRVRTIIKQALDLGSAAITLAPCAMTRPAKAISCQDEQARRGGLTGLAPVQADCVLLGSFGRPGDR